MIFLPKECKAIIKNLNLNNYPQASRFLVVIFFGYLAGCSHLNFDQRSDNNGLIQDDRCNPESPNLSQLFPPEKQVKTTYAQGFTVDYYPGYKLVMVTNPWQDAQRTFQYLLVQCGVPIPTDFPEAQVVQIPVRQVIALSTTHLPFLDQLGVLNTLQGVRRFQEVSNPQVRSQIAEGKLTQVGTANDLNLELILELQPDLVTTFGIANVETSTIDQLQKLGIPTAVVAEYLEDSPLAQAEWIKFIATFYNQETVANHIFQHIQTDYERLKHSTKAVQNRPQVLTGFSIEGTWYVAGGRSFIAQYIEDAGGDYLWRDNPNTGNIPLSLEAVFNRGKTADIWINVNPLWSTLQEAIVDDQRYQKFLPLQQGQVFNNDRLLNPDGGNDYWESGIMAPQVILADLIHIFHPNLFPEYQLVYYRKIGFN